MEKMPTYKEIHKKLAELSQQNVDERSFFGETTVIGAQSDKKVDESSKKDANKFFQSEYICPWQIS